MAQNFIACDREQELLLPPSLREWLPEDHLAWFVIDAVDGFDLAAFLASYRADGHGRAAAALGAGSDSRAPPASRKQTPDPRSGRCCHKRWAGRQSHTHR